MDAAGLATRLGHRLTYWPIDKLNPYSGNARTHSDAQIDQIGASILEFGFTRPILAEDNGDMIAGHGSLLAAKKLGMTEVPVVVLTGLTEAQRRAYILADNRLALESGWDETVLADELRALEADDFNLTLLGFNDEELAQWIPPEGAGEFAAGTSGQQGKLDQRTPIICPNCKHEFFP
jgi:ParB-like chromosome segregation protein Spo0J